MIFADELEENLEKINTKDRLEKIEFDLQTATQLYFQSQENIDEIEKLISPLRDKKASLQTQLELFEEQIRQTSVKIQNVEIQINQKRLEIAKLQETIERAELEITEEKEMVFEFVQKMYKEEKKFFGDYSATPELIKLLLSDSSISKTLQELEFLEVMEELGRDIFRRLGEANQFFTEKKQEHEQKTESLTNLKHLLEREKLNLLVQKQGREKLFFETAGEEAKYQKLLTESKSQAEAALIAIANLRDNQESIQSQVDIFDEEHKNERAQKQKEIVKEILSSAVDTSEYNLEDLVEDLKLDAPLMWPISPDRGITAKYLDNSYKDYFGVAHNAIDIRAPQGTSIFAPASAYVQEIQDNGLGYSYIILAHKEGLSTLYGHVSEINVEEGELIQMGTMIGKTGGTPGTQGAGVMTTGPHLHLEVHKNGKHVNPIHYFPLELLPKAYRN